MTEIIIRDCEITVLVVTFFATLANILIGLPYLKKLYTDMHKGIYIQGDKHHSQQHFAIVGICMIISIAMFVSTFELQHIQHTFVEHLAFNLLCIFIIYKHLINE